MVSDIVNTSKVFCEGIQGKIPKLWFWAPLPTKFGLKIMLRWKHLIQFNIRKNSSPHQKFRIFSVCTYFFILFLVFIFNYKTTTLFSLCLIFSSITIENLEDKKWSDKIIRKWKYKIFSQTKQSFRCLDSW
jgi:hypothetical protein